MRGLLLLGTFVVILTLLIAGDLASDAPTSGPITEERVCAEEDFSPAFNFGEEDVPSASFNFADAGDVAPRGCEPPPALHWAR